MSQNEALQEEQSKYKKTVTHFVFRLAPLVGRTTLTGAASGAMRGRLGLRQSRSADQWEDILAQSPVKRSMST